MPKYVDGYVMPIKKKNVAAYKKMAKEGANAWMRHGALAYVECVGEDLAPKQMDPSNPVVRFGKMAGAKPDETVVFAFVTYKSRKHRDQVNARVMKEMSEAYEGHEHDKMPFDPARMAYGGFEVLVEGK